MRHNCLGIPDERGFLMQPDPLPSLAAGNSGLEPSAVAALDEMAQHLPDYLADRTIRDRLNALPVYDVSVLADADCRTIERAFQIYSYFASAFVHAPELPPVKHIPRSVALPLVELSEMVSRPPILAYASYTLANWQRKDPQKPIEVDNLELVQKFIHKKDAAWFTLIHVDIEARAAEAVRTIPRLAVALKEGNHGIILTDLEAVQKSLQAMQVTLKRMPEHCHPRVYYNEVRPYIFGFDDIIYRGVPGFNEQPQSFRGETGAQSSIIPALVALLGLQHEQTGLTQHLHIMRDYMPKPHRKLISRIDGSTLRDYVERNRDNVVLRDVYNAVLDELLAFRKLHLRYAASYIFNQDPDSKGTGGTMFMDWLQQLIDETDKQFIR
jgi:indoleamine 2,3-dioxygenase